MHWSWRSEFESRPSDWRLCRLGEVIDVIAGQSPDGSTINDSGIGEPFLQGNAEFGSIHPHALYHCTAAKKRSLKGDTLISVRAPVGEVNLSDQSYALGRGLAALRSTDIDSVLLFFGMQHWRHSLRKVSQGTTFDAIGEGNLRSMWVCFSNDPVEQKALGLAFQLVDNHIIATYAAIAAAERLQKGLMRELLSGRIRADGTARADADWKPDEKVGTIPRGWRVEPLKNLATVQRGRFSHRPRNEPRFFGGPYPFIQTADIVEARGYIRRHSQTLNEEGLRISRLFPRGTIMITIAANIGDTAIASYDVCATDSVIGITPNPGVNSEFLELSLRLWKRRLEQVATESAQKNINYGNLRPLLITIPNDEDEQAEIATTIFDFERLIEAKRAKITALHRLKKSLMQNLLTGRKRLSQELIAALSAVTEEEKSGGA